MNDKPILDGLNEDLSNSTVASGSPHAEPFSVVLNSLAAHDFVREVRGLFANPKTEELPAIATICSLQDDGKGNTIYTFPADSLNAKQKNIIRAYAAKFTLETHDGPLDFNFPESIENPVQPAGMGKQPVKVSAQVLPKAKIVPSAKMKPFTVSFPTEGLKSTGFAVLVSEILTKANNGRLIELEDLGEYCSKTIESGMTTYRFIPPTNVSESDFVAKALKAKYALIRESAKELVKVEGLKGKFYPGSDIAQHIQ